MSRVGNKIIPIPATVKVAIAEHSLDVKGPKGNLTTIVPEGIHFELTDGTLVAKRASDSKQHRALHGLARSLAANAVKGVTDGFQRDLEIVGIGYRAELRGNSLVFSLGFSHPIEYPLPKGITVAVEKQTKLSLSGIDKQLVGEVAAKIRGLRKPDPYKNKGIRYAGEVLKKKVGKTGAK
jgi:large subunit ribosomal protein L6